MSRKRTRNDDDWFKDESGSGNEYRYIDDGIDGRNQNTRKGWSGRKGGRWETHDLPRDYDPDDD